MLAHRALPAARLSLALCLVSISVSASAQYTLEDAFPNLGFTSPVAIENPGDGTDRLFVVEQQGRIVVFDNDPQTTTSTTFLDIRGIVASGSEAGMLGLAFHPDYGNNRFFYIYYTINDGGGLVSQLVRYQTSASNPNGVIPSSRTVLMEVDQPDFNHNGGEIAFGPDGYLHWALGDGGGGGDTYGNGQNRTTLLGTILRLDVDNTQGNLEYAIPADNPFVGNTSGWREEIFAYGLRNVWRFSFDSAGTLWAADVGQWDWEEIDHIIPGGNYGWPIVEGPDCFQLPGCDQSPYEAPVYSYSHSGLDLAVTGGHVYEGSLLPGLVGRYVFGDYGSGKIWALDLSKDPESKDHPSKAATATLLATLPSFFNLSSFGLDQAGELLVCSLGGTIYRLVSDGTPAPGTPVAAVALEGVAPNPFNPSTTIELSVLRPTTVELVVYDAAGRRVRELLNEPRAAGPLRVEWNGRDDAGHPVTSGVYRIRLTAGDRTEEASAVLLK